MPSLPTATDNPPAAGDPGRPPADRLAPIHADAARMDGMVKILVGLVFTVFSLSLIAVLVFAVRLILHERTVAWWAILIGLPGLALLVIGLTLMGMGIWKLCSGRGRG